MREITERAILSVNREYRYALRRDLDDAGASGTILFVMLNPSTANANVDDATIRRCIGFARAGRYRTLLVGNLYAYRSRNPKKIEHLLNFDRIGVENDLYLRRMREQAEAWGFKPSTLLTWCKPPMGLGLGGTFVNTTEFVIFARRGSLKAQERVPSTWWEWSRPYIGRGGPTHSAKPEAFLDLVERVSPAPRLEMFARRNRLGWHTWGNQSLEHVEVAANRE